MNKKLKQMRLNKSLSQSQVAKYANISERQYRRIELEDQAPNVKTAILIAEILNTTVEQIFKN